MAWVSCELCGTVGHSIAECKFASIDEPSFVDFDEAGRLLLQRLEKANSVGTKALPSQFNETGQRLLERLGRLKGPQAATEYAGHTAEGKNEAAQDNTAEAAMATKKEGDSAACTRRKGCPCVLCDSGYVALSKVWQVPGHWALNLIWKPEHGNGEVYVGGLQAASNAQLLRTYGITHVVNCMNRPSLNDKPGIAYYDFPIERYDSYRKALWEPVANTSKANMLVKNAATACLFFEPVMSFIQSAYEGGGKVLIHCFAGAHRAGTTGVAFLMHMEKLNADDAIATAQCLRPVIDPKSYDQLYLLLLWLQEGLFGGVTDEMIRAALGENRSLE